MTLRQIPRCSRIAASDDRPTTYRVASGLSRGLGNLNPGRLFDFEVPCVSSYRPRSSSVDHLVLSRIKFEDGERIERRRRRCGGARAALRHRDQNDPPRGGEGRQCGRGPRRRAGRAEPGTCLRPRGLVGPALLCPCCLTLRTVMCPCCARGWCHWHVISAVCIMCRSCGADVAIAPPSPHLIPSNPILP